MFSTAPPPGVIAAALAGLRLVDSAEGAQLCEKLHARVQEVHRGLAELGWRLPAPSTAIVPLLIGAEAEAWRLAASLREKGVLVPAIRFPTVPRGRARLRLSVSARHTPDDVNRLLWALREALQETGIRPPEPAP
jgi:8-amino-7-oxononanoate synthase